MQAYHVGDLFSVKATQETAPFVVLFSKITESQKKQTQRRRERERETGRQTERGIVR